MPKTEIVCLDKTPSLNHFLQRKKKMAMKIDKLLIESTKKLLTPLVRILLRNGMSHNTFSLLSKQVYVDVASQDFALSGKKRSISRVSLLTGLSRKEVSQLKKAVNIGDVYERYNRAVRVLSGWIRDKRFVDSKGNPLALLLDGPSPTFAELVKLYSGDIHTKAVLDELTRAGVVESLKDGRIKLVSRGYVPNKEKSDVLGMIGTDVSELISVFDHNLVCNHEEKFFQRKVSYDNMPEESLPELRKLTAKNAQKLLELLNEYMSKHDRDVNKNSKGKGRKYAAIGIYYIEKDFGRE